MIAIIDYEMGNLRSVQKGFERVGHAAAITSDPAVLADADKIVLPGVGAFRDAIAALRERKLVEPIRAAIDAGKPFLGICLGLQLLFDVSYEDGEHEGLGVVPGEVVRFRRAARVQGAAHGLEPGAVPPPAADLRGRRRRRTFLLRALVLRRAAKDAAVVATETDYAAPFCSSIWRDNLFAVQFHPEKSQAAGLRLLKNFAELC